MIRSVFALAIALSGLTTASPALAAGASAPAKAVVVRRLSLVKTDDLDFGTIARGAATGTVTINAATGVRTTTGGVIAQGGTPQRAIFVGAGQIGILSFVSIGPSPVLSNGAGGTMPTVLAVNGGTGIRLFPGTGVQTFQVGGTLTVGANQAEGDYTGSFTLTVNYL